MKPSPMCAHAGRNASEESELVPFGENGAPIGQWSSRAKYSDAEVEAVRTLRDDGMTYRAIAKKMEMPASTVWALCNGRLRSSSPKGWKRRMR